MEKHFFLTVQQVVRETSDVVTIIFEPLPKETIHYQPGQFLTFLLTLNGATLRRSYSLSSSPQLDESLAVSIKRVPGGLVSNYLYHSVKPGDVLETLAPMGRFVAKPDNQHPQTLVLIGAGSGITPLFSMIRSILYTEPTSQVWLIYGNHNQDSILYKDRLDALQQQYGSSRFQLTHVLSQPTAGWKGLTGRITQPLLTTLFAALSVDQLARANVYICGPDAMRVEVQLVLSKLGIAMDRIFTERFSTLFLSAESGNNLVAADQDESSIQVTVFYSGHEYRFAVAPEKTILQAALDRHINLPYSCQMGICMSCLGKCTSGEVKLDEEDSLLEAERQAGYVLTCLAHPISQHVVIEIDS